MCLFSIDSSLTDRQGGREGARKRERVQEREREREAGKEREREIEERMCTDNNIRNNKTKDTTPQ